MDLRVSSGYETSICDALRRNGSPRMSYGCLTWPTPNFRGVRSIEQIVSVIFTYIKVSSHSIKGSQPAISLAAGVEEDQHGRA